MNQKATTKKYTVPSARLRARRYGLCAVCGSEISSADRVFTFGTDELMCFECALERHGIFDEQQDRWTRAPEVTDLLERSALDR